MSQIIYTGTGWLKKTCFCAVERPILKLGLQILNGAFILYNKKINFSSLRRKTANKATAVFADFGGFSDKKAVGAGDLYFFLFIIKVKA